VIESIKVENFKSIRNLEIDLAPLTIFVGPNGSGKSSILEAVALMKQCIGGIGEINEYRSVVDSIKGELVDFEDKKHIFCEEIEDRFLSLGLVADVEIKDIREAAIKDSKRFSKRGRETKNASLRNYVDFLSNLLRSLDLQLLSKKLVSKKGTVRIEYLNRIKGDKSSYEHSYSINRTCMAYKQKKRREFECTPPEVKLRMGAEFLPLFLVSDYETQLSKTISRILRSKIENVFYLSAERGFIPWTYRAGSRAEWVGRRGEHTLEILARLMEPEYEDKRLPYELFCEKFGIKSVWAGWKEHDILTSGYKDPFLESSHRFPSLGYGSKQLLPVIAQLAYSDTDSIILVEEPEMSLHPGYQRLLAALFGRAVNEGKQILVTTHSSYFPLSLDLVLKEKGFPVAGQTTRGRKKYKIKLSVNDVAVYHVKRGRKGYTNIEKLEVDENGLKEGIPSFIKVEKEILERFISRE